MWFAASLLFVSRHTPDSRPESTWEESIRLIEADTEVDARMKAERLGRDEVVSCEANNEHVTWTFDRIQKVYALGELLMEHGFEVFSRFLSDSTVSTLLTSFDDE